MKRQLTLPFRSAKHTHTVTLQVMRLHSLIRLTLNDFLLLTNKRIRKREEIEVDVRAHIHTIIIVRHRLCIYTRIFIDDSLISFKHQIMYIE